MTGGDDMSGDDMSGGERRERLGDARLYLCTGIRDGGADLARFLDAVLANGVDIVQLRDKHADALEQLRAARLFRAAADRHGALFILNDRADLAAAARADGVHLGQQDLPPEDARELLGPDVIIGRSTHDLHDLRRAAREPVDYLGVGPVNATPTKPGRDGVGVGSVTVAAAEATVPWFVTGGMNVETIPEVRAAGASRFVVVRAITQARDPAEATARLRAILDTRI